MNNGSSISVLLEHFSFSLQRVRVYLVVGEYLGATLALQVQVLCLEYVVDHLILNCLEILLGDFTGTMPTNRGVYCVHVTAGWLVVFHTMLSWWLQIGFCFISVFIWMENVGDLWKEPRTLLVFLLLVSLKFSRLFHRRLLLLLLVLLRLLIEDLKILVLGVHLVRKQEVVGLLHLLRGITHIQWERVRLFKLISYSNKFKWALCLN